MPYRTATCKRLRVDPRNIRRWIAHALLLYSVLQAPRKRRLDGTSCSFCQSASNHGGVGSTEQTSAELSGSIHVGVGSTRSVRFFAQAGPSHCFAFPDEVMLCEKTIA